MTDEMTAISDFVDANRKALAGFIRQKLMLANAKPYLDRIGKEGIEALEREAAGVLLDLACAFLSHLHPERQVKSEEVLDQLPAHFRSAVHLPRSNMYFAVLADLERKLKDRIVDPDESPE